MLAAIVELDVRPGDEILDRGGHEYLRRASVLLDACCDVDGHARDFVVVSDLDLTGVEAHPYLETERPNRVAHRAPALDCSSGSVEGGDEAIAPGADLPAAETFQLPTDGPVMSIDEVAPLPVTQRRQVFGGPDDVGEQHRREDPVGPSGRGERR